MNHYEQIKAEVVKVCPEILELKFGCEINILFDIATSPQKIIGVNTDRTVRTEQYSSLNTQDLEILGSPIELHHILRTMGAVTKSSDYSYFLGVGGLFSRSIDGKEDTTWEALGSYNLSLPVAQQEEPTLKSLAELLTGNK